MFQSNKKDLSFSGLEEFFRIKTFGGIYLILAIRLFEDLSGG